MSFFFGTPCRSVCVGDKRYFKIFGAIHFIYYINISIGTKVDLTYLDY